MGNGNFFIAYLIILTENALHITSGEKDVADAVWSGNGRFFAMMNADGRNIEGWAGVAVPRVFREPVGMTVPWTDGAVVKCKKHFRGGRKIHAGNQFLSIFGTRKILTHKFTLFMKMQARKYSHIIWDWNGTLLNDAWLCVEVMNRMLSERNLPPLSLEKYRTIFDFPVKDYYQKLGFDFTSEPFEAVGMEFMILYNLRQNECVLHREVVQILETFEEKGYKQHILSAREENELKLETTKLGVAKYFDSITGLKDHYAHGKSEIGRSLLTAIDIPAEKIIFIGDTHHDAEVAAELGIDCILIPNGHHSEERILDCGVPVAYSLNELLENL